jgi:hypothetical protein
MSVANDCSLQALRVSILASDGFGQVQRFLFKGFV